jgi:hypothetical protein
VADDMSADDFGDDAIDVDMPIHLPPSVLEEVKRRMAESDADPSSLLTLEQVWQRVGELRGENPSKNSQGD